MPYTQRLKALAGRYLPFLKIRPTIDREAVFRLRPVRNAAIQWEATADGEALLTVPARKDRLGKLASMWLKMPESKAVQLDEVGTFVWGLCDGSLTVDAIVRQTSREYKLNRREVEVSVTTYLQMLAERNFIGFYKRGAAQK